MENGRAGQPVSSKRYFYSQPGEARLSRALPNRFGRSGEEACRKASAANKFAMQTSLM